MANETARHLHKHMTPHEVRVWLQLRALRPQGLHFRRQAPIGSIIVDFACKRAGLVVELDRAQHGMPDHQPADTKRDQALSSANSKVLRFWHVEVERSLEGVIGTIFHETTARLS